MQLPPRFDQRSRLPKRAPLLGTVVPTAAQRLDGKAPFGPQALFGFWEANGRGAGPERHGSRALEQPVNQFVRQGGRPVRRKRVVSGTFFAPGPFLLPWRGVLLPPSLLVLPHPPSAPDRPAGWSL